MRDRLQNNKLKDIIEKERFKNARTPLTAIVCGSSNPGGDSSHMLCDEILGNFLSSFSRIAIFRHAFPYSDCPLKIKRQVYLLIE